MPDSSRQSIWPGGAILAILAAACTALVAFTHSFTAPRIAANEQAYLERSLAPVLEGIDYEGDLSQSTIVLDSPHDLPGTAAAIVYRVFAAGQPVAALFVVTPRDGYSGPIRLLIGVAASGHVTGVRALSHRETPGLGDQIDVDKSDWILQFNGRSLDAPPIAAWSIRGDGGEFDQMTGASITSRAIVKAVRETLIYFGENREQVFARQETGE
jgi:electron transport complex protein RnfG